MAKEFRFAVLQFLPSVLRQESVNLGVVVMDAGWPEAGEAMVRMLPEREWEWLERAYPEVVMDELRSYEVLLKRDFMEGTESPDGERKKGRLLYELREWHSQGLRMTDYKPVYSNSLAEATESLAREQLLRRTVERQERGKAGRTQVLERMREEFRVWGVLEHPAMRRRIAVSDWVEGKSSRMVVDFGYATRDGREFKMYQAVDATRDVEALRLARVWPRLRDGVRQKAQREARLTAVVGESPDEEAVEVMEEAGVRVAMVGEMERIAKMAAEELL